eukprot:4181157-Pyramimonas_sp.AAC.1
MTDNNPNDKSFMCYECGATFAKTNAFYVHMGKLYPADDHPTRWAHGTRCLTWTAAYHTFGRLVKHLPACTAFAAPWQRDTDRHDEATTEANRVAIRVEQRANIKAGLPPPRVHTVSYKADTPPLYTKDHEATRERPIPATVPRGASIAPYAHT